MRVNDMLNRLRVAAVRDRLLSAEDYRTRPAGKSSAYAKTQVLVCEREIACVSLATCWIANGEKFSCLGGLDIGQTHPALVFGREAIWLHTVRRSYHSHCVACQGLSRPARGVVRAIFQAKARDHR